MILYVHKELRQRIEKCENLEFLMDRLVLRLCLFNKVYRKFIFFHKHGENEHGFSIYYKIFQLSKIFFQFLFDLLNFYKFDS